METPIFLDPPSLMCNRPRWACCYPANPPQPASTLFLQEAGSFVGVRAWSPLVPDGRALSRAPAAAHRRVPLSPRGVEGMSITIADVEAARRTIAGQVLRTPMLPAPKLSAMTGTEVYVKYANLQVTNSFKDRGALNKLASLSESTP